MEFLTSILGSQDAALTLVGVVAGAIVGILTSWLLHWRSKVGAQKIFEATLDVLERVSRVAETGGSYTFTLERDKQGRPTGVIHQAVRLDPVTLSMSPKPLTPKNDAAE